MISQTIPQLKSKSFGVVIDEVILSSGETSRHLKMSLSKQVLSEYSEGEGNKDLTEIDEQVMNQILSRGQQPHISILDLVGHQRERLLNSLVENKMMESSIRSHILMEQSIYEGFTLDVLQNYTTYERFFKLTE